MTAPSVGPIKHRSESFEVVMLATPHVEHYAGKTRLSWEHYCARHGYAFFPYDRKLLPDLHINWTRLEMVRERQRQGSSEWVVLVDADTLVLDEAFAFDRLVAPYAGKDVLFAPDATRRFGAWWPLDLGGFTICRTWRPPNGGFVLVRNNEFGRYFFDLWIALARGRLRHLADRHPRTQGVLWRGLYRRHRDSIAVMHGEVVRAGTNRVLDRLSLDTSRAFVLHDKRLTLGGTESSVAAPVSPTPLLEPDASTGG